MSFYRTLYHIKEALVVSFCPSCKKLTRYSGTLCPDCLEKYTEELAAECRFCHLPAHLCVCSTRDLYYCRSLGLSMRSMIFYEPENTVFSALLKSFKYDADRGAEKFFARELSRELLLLFAKRREMPTDWAVTFPPRRRSAVKRYGFDQSCGLAKRIAKYTGASFEEVLVHRGNAAQKTLDASSRAENAMRSFELKKNARTAGKKYVIVDDVVTSGATMKTCQTLLLSSGAKEAFVLSVSKTPRRGAGFDTGLSLRRPRQKPWFK